MAAKRFEKKANADKEISEVFKEVMGKMEEESRWMSNVKTRPLMHSL